MIDIHTTIRENLRIDEVVELLGVTRRTVYYWIENETVESLLSNGSIRIPIEEVRRIYPKYCEKMRRRKTDQGNQPATNV